MRYAKSLFYGVILDAEKADYKDYSNWLLVCPRCNEPVYLVAGSIRREHERHTPKTRELITVKQAVVSSSFAHFKGLGDERCDNFSGTITPAYVAKISAFSRGQRLTVFNNHFLDIIGYDSQNTSAYFDLFKSVNNVNNKLAKGAYDAAIKDYYALLYNSSDFSDVARGLLESCKIQVGDLVFDGKYPFYYLDFAAFIGRLDIDMQLVVLAEVFAFLKTSAAKKIMRQIFDYSFNRFVQASNFEECRYLLSVGTKTDLQIKQDCDNLFSAMGRLFYQSLTFVDWFGEVQKLSAR